MKRKWNGTLVRVSVSGRFRQAFLCAYAFALATSSACDNSKGASHSYGDGAIPDVGSQTEPSPDSPDAGASDVVTRYTWQPAFAPAQSPEWTVAQWSPAITKILEVGDSVAVTTSSELVLTSEDYVTWRAHIAPVKAAGAIAQTKGALRLWRPNIGVTYTLEPDGLWSSEILPDGLPISFLGALGETLIAQQTAKQFLRASKFMRWQPVLLPDGQSTVRAGATANGKSVLVGDAGQVALSVDGISWAVSESRLHGDLIGVTAGAAGGFAAAAKTGSLFVSANGQGWTKTFTEPTVKFEQIMGRTGRVVAVGSIRAGPEGKTRGYLATSADGQEWATMVYPKAANFPSLALHKSNFVVAADNALLTSLDGIQWREQVLTKDRQLNEVVFGAGRFVAVGTDGVLITSLDGVQWLQADIPFKKVIHDVTQVDDGSLIAAGSEGILQSADGLTWAQVPTTPQLGFKSVARGVLPGTGWLGLAADDRLYVSTDLLTWTVLPVSEVGGGMVSGASANQGTSWHLAATPHGFVAYGIGGYKFLTSTDGRMWRSTTTQQSSSNLSVAMDDIVVPTRTGLERYAWSVEANTWQPKGKLFGETGLINCVAKNASGYVVHTPLQIVQSRNIVGVIWKASTVGIALSSPSMAASDERIVIVSDDGLIITRSLNNIAGL